VHVWYWNFVSWPHSERWCHRGLTSYSLTAVSLVRLIMTAKILPNLSETGKMTLGSQLILTYRIHLLTVPQTQTRIPLSSGPTLNSTSGSWSPSWHQYVNSSNSYSMALSNPTALTALPRRAADLVQQRSWIGL
jgi:hypothetical protein